MALTGVDAKNGMSMLGGKTMDAGALASENWDQDERTNDRRVPTPETPTKVKQESITAPSTPARSATAVNSPGKHAFLKPAVTAMSIIGHWNSPYGEVENKEDASLEDNYGRAEVAIFAKIIPVPGTTLEIMHYHKNMVLKRNSFRVIPLLPDGSSPRVTPGSTALGIETVSGRFRRTSDGKTKILRRKTYESESIDIIDGIYDSDGEDSSGSEETISSSIADLISPDMFLDGAYSETAGNREELKVRDEVDARDVVERWMESYNSGTKLSMDSRSFLCVSFDERMRRDALVVEIYLEVEPIITPVDKAGVSTFIFGGLPFCPSGIQVSFTIDSSDIDSEFIYTTQPALQDTHSLGKNMLSGTFHSNGNLNETIGSTLIIRTQKVESIQEPANYSTDITTRVGLISLFKLGRVVFVYMIRIVLNGMKPLESTKRAKLTFEVYNVRATDDWNLTSCPGATTRVTDDPGCIILEIVRPTSEIFDDINLRIMTDREMETLEAIDLPKFVSIEGIALAETILLEELGDQPLSYYSLEDRNSWRVVPAHIEKTWQWSTAYELIDFAEGSAPHFRLGISVDDFADPGEEIVEEGVDNIVNHVKYTVYPSWDIHEGKQLYKINMLIEYNVAPLRYNRRAFTLSSEEWALVDWKYDGKTNDHGLFFPCSEDEDLWVVLNHAPGRIVAGKDIHQMECEWTRFGVTVGLNENGEVIRLDEFDDRYEQSNAEDALDLYECMEVPCVIDQWVQGLDFEVNGRVNARNISTMAQKNSAQKREPSYSPTETHQAFVAARKSGVSRVQLSAKNHFRRRALDGEVFRDEDIYVTRTGPRIFIYIPKPKGEGTNGIGLRSPLPMSEIFNDVPEQEKFAAQHGGIRGSHFVLDDERTDQREGMTAPSKPSHSTSDDNLETLSPISTPLLAFVSSPGFRSPGPPEPVSQLTSVDSFGSDITLTTPSDAQTEDRPQENKMNLNTDLDVRRSTSKRPRISPERVQVNSININRHAEEAGLALLRRKIKKTSKSREQATPTKPKPFIQRLVSFFWTLIRLAFIIITITFVMTVSIGAYKNTAEAMQEIAQVRDEMKRFRSMFESVYGVNFGDARWRRVQMREEGDLLVLVRGAALQEGDVVLRRVILQNKGDILSSEGFWMDAKKEFAVEDRSGEKEMQKEDGGGLVVDRKTSSPLEEKATRYTDDDSLTSPSSHDMFSITSPPEDEFSAAVCHTERMSSSTMSIPAQYETTKAIASWGGNNGGLSIPWQEVRNILAEGREAVAEVAGKVIEVIEDGWKHFLLAWRAVWWMT